MKSYLRFSVLQSKYLLQWIISLVLLAPTCIYAQGLTAAQVDSVAKNDLKLFDVPGLAIGIIKDGKLVYSKGFGVRSLATGQPVNEQTLFGIASNTKAFTAAALGILVDDGKIKWDDKVTQYIPDFRLYDDYATREMTIRDLLCHRSGLATGAGDLMHDPDSTSFTVNEIIHNLRYLKPAYSFRSKFAYDNNLYIVAGEVIARVSKMSWEDFVEKRILQPLQMSQSSASYLGAHHRTNIIDAHNQLNGTMQVVTRYTSTKDDAAGGVYSNITDMSKWVLMLMNQGRYGDAGKQLLSPQTVQELLTPQTIIPVNGSGPYQTHFGAYGLGWFIVDTKGYKEIFHTGEDVGMVSEVAMIPELGLGVIVLTNNESDAIDAIANQILDSYLNITGIDEAKPILTRTDKILKKASAVQAAAWAEAARNAKTQPAANQYTGTYHDRWFGNITISKGHNGQLWFASQRSAQLRGTMTYYGHETFIVRWQNPEIDGDSYVVFNSLNRSITLKAVVPNSGFNFSDLEFKRILH